MNEQAQNALLKTLEEPPADTSLVLLASAPDKLLPTIRSRCARVAFAPAARLALIARDRGPRAQAGRGDREAGGGARRRLAGPRAGAGREGARAGARSSSRQFEAVGTQRAPHAALRGDLRRQSHRRPRRPWTCCCSGTATWRLASVGAGGLASADLDALAREVAGRLDASRAPSTGRAADADPGGDRGAQRLGAPAAGEAVHRPDGDAMSAELEDVLAGDQGGEARAALPRLGRGVPRPQVRRRSSPPRCSRTPSRASTRW